MQDEEVNSSLQEIAVEWKQQVVQQQHEDLEDEYLLLQHAYLIESNFK